MILALIQEIFDLVVESACLAHRRSSFARIDHQIEMQASIHSHLFVGSTPFEHDFGRSRANRPPPRAMQNMDGPSREFE